MDTLGTRQLGEMWAVLRAFEKTGGAGTGTAQAVQEELAKIAEILRETALVLYAKKYRRDELVLHL